MQSANATTGYVVVFINEHWYTQYLVKVPCIHLNLGCLTVKIFIGGQFVDLYWPNAPSHVYSYISLWYCLKSVTHFQQGEGGRRHSEYCEHCCISKSKLENTSCDPINRIITLVPHWGLIHAIMEIIANNAPCFGGDAGNSGSSIWRRMFTLTMTNARTCAPRT